MKKGGLHKTVLNKRSFLMMTFQAVALSLLAIRLFYLQFTQKDRYRTLSDKNRLRIKLLAPKRGVIFDVNGITIAKNISLFRVYIIKGKTAEMEKSLTELSKIIELEDKHIKQILTQAKALRTYTPILIKEKLDIREMSKISVHKIKLPRIEVSIGQSRVYLHKQAFAHTLGYVGKISAKDVANENNALLGLPGFEIGKSGVEKSYEKKLRGKAGAEQLEVNVGGKAIRVVDRKEPEKGKDLYLTIDSRLQNFVSRALEKHKSASVVVMDINTGAIRAMVSKPSFDPNMFVDGIGIKDWNDIISNKQRPLVDKTINGQYPPASTFKLMVALAALKFGIDPKDHVFCRGYLDIGSNRFHCWKRLGHGRVNLTKSIRESCDVWYYETALKIGIKNIATMAKSFGLGETFNLGFGSQSKGIVPDKEWKLKRYNKKWLIGETVLSAIGQGYVLATPLQLTVMTARLASGVEVSPFVSMLDPNFEPRQFNYKNIDIDPSHLARVQKGMYQVVNHPLGTARRTRSEGWVIAGKTGTAQVHRISRSERTKQGYILRKKNLRWELKDHALFVGYGPFEAARYAVTCIVEHGGGGSAVAAPIVRDVFNEIERLESLDNFV